MVKGFKIVQMKDLRRAYKMRQEESNEWDN